MEILNMVKFEPVERERLRRAADRTRPQDGMGAQAVAREGRPFTASELTDAETNLIATRERLGVTFDTLRDSPAPAAPPGGGVGLIAHDLNLVHLADDLWEQAKADIDPALVLLAEAIAATRGGRR